jgi:MoxR-like ATPase
MTKTQAKVAQWIKEIGECVLQRAEVARNAGIAILSGEHVLMIGKPGTAKSLLTRAICKSITGTSYFERLLTKESKQDELFGPIDVQAFKKGEYRRILKGTFAETHIGFLDEIFKCNSALLNALLTAINERVYSNGGNPEPIPLMSVFGASNEFPEGEELGALYDRFLLRHVVNYIEGDTDYLKLINGQFRAPEDVCKVSIEDIKAAQKEIAKIKVSDAAIQTILKIRNDMLSSGIEISDRRSRKVLPMARAYAYLDGSDAVEKRHLLFLKDMLWDDPNQMDVVRRIVFTNADPVALTVIEFEDRAKDIRDEALKTTGDRAQAGIDAQKKFEALAVEIRRMPETPELLRVVEKVQEFNREVLKRSLGI